VFVQACIFVIDNMKGTSLPQNLSICNTLQISDAL
jgi:hypothetical protein